MQITTDEYIYYKNGLFKINRTLIFSWIIMIVLSFIAIIINRKIKKKSVNDKDISIIQAVSELVISFIENQVKDGTSIGVNIIFPFVATLFLFIIFSNLISLIPFCYSPTGSLSTTVALSLITFIFAICFGIKEKGLRYFKKYFEPVFIMAPINIIGDIAKVASMSIRLYGNVVSSSVIIMILSEIMFLSVGFPILINILGMISGVIQAYIFSTLAIMLMSLNN